MLRESIHAMLVLPSEDTPEWKALKCQRISVCEHKSECGLMCAYVFKNKGERESWVLRVFTDDEHVGD